MLLFLKNKPIEYCKQSCTYFQVAVTPPQERAPTTSRSGHSSRCAYAPEIPQQWTIPGESVQVHGAHVLRNHLPRHPLPRTSQSSLTPAPPSCGCPPRSASGVT
ncbi:hypothetical protein CEXT_239631 [Caerostris extrusa]|uniref:Uncharacterized protein n=1 Tax=Caerostris extrusa TaxID=172846 RepID=A0AAV4PVG7_CAEEX|nr:hypothetical protein CEXT_239631 [Caerostris extrusa]